MRGVVYLRGVRVRGVVYLRGGERGVVYLRGGENEGCSISEGRRE